MELILLYELIHFLFFNSWTLLDIELELIGKEFGDIIDFSGGCILISEMFLESWNKSKLIGLSGFFNVSILRVKNNRKRNIVPPRYFLANIARSRTAIDAKRSVLIQENGEICPECRLGGGIKRVARVVIERNSWAGEDIFIARGMPGTVIVTEYFKEFCENNEIKNAVLIEAEKYFFDFYRSEN